jgi:hypothetical protein
VVSFDPLSKSECHRVLSARYGELSSHHAFSTVCCNAYLLTMLEERIFWSGET